MTDAQNILSMIEVVDPADTAKLDEIDARVYCFVNDRRFIKYKLDHHEKYLIVHTDDEDAISIKTPRYTRNRDALKHIRPPGFILAEMGHEFISYLDGDFTVYGEERGYFAHILKPFCESIASVSKKSGFLPTEELAELHAVLQAIEYERNVQNVQISPAHPEN